MLDKIKSKKISSSILAIIILVLLLICSFVLFFEVNDYRNIITQDYNMYYYFSKERTDFNAIFTYDVNEQIIGIESNGITLNSTPLYFKDNEKQMVLPENMEIVYPYKNNPMYKLGKYSKIYIKNNFMYIKSENDIGRLYDCFLYDGEDLYVFVEDVTIMVDDNRYDLTPMSFVEVNNSYARIYNKGKNEYTYIDNINKKVEAFTDEYAINLSDDTFTYENAFYILIKNVDGLDYVEFN